MNELDEFLDAVHGELTVLLALYPEDFPDETFGTYEDSVARLFEEWAGVRSCIHGQTAKLDEIEAMIHETLVILEDEERRKEGRFMLQDIRLLLPGLQKLQGHNP